MPDPVAGQPAPSITHGGPGCTCSYAGEDPHCPHHGYEAVIQRQQAALGAIEVERDQWERIAQDWQTRAASRLDEINEGIAREGRVRVKLDALRTLLTGPEAVSAARRALMAHAPGHGLPLGTTERMLTAAADAVLPLPAPGDPGPTQEKP